ncbi:hypothetical protein V6N12_007923 [Hibiscus sabdariffa]|uniref:Endonuclease/exonuclease/phosphatase domain-containing protein n=2 Tax=Hibiscus sabdariffa TaxID=183260 RepID=A0ABR1ZYY5_9ROSI
MKKRAIQHLLRQHRCGMVVLLETKLEVITDRMVQRVWYTDNYEYVFAHAKGRAGGILIVWDSERFRLLAKEMVSRYVVVEGTWIKDDWRCGVIGVYAPCVFEEQVRLWGVLGGVIVSKQHPWCVCGDFNMVLRPEESWGCSTMPKGMSEFGDFNMRFEQTVARSLPRGLSDHTPLLLLHKIVDGGARPFRFINAWMADAKNVRMMVVEWSWLKEAGEDLSMLQRLRSFKPFIRDLNLSSFGDVDRGIISVTKQIDELDNYCRDDLKSQEVVDKKKVLQGELWKLSRYSESIRCEKLRVT